MYPGKNISIIPGDQSTQYITAHATPGVSFVGNDMYQPLNALISPYQDHVILVPGVPSIYGSLQQAGYVPPPFFYPSDIAAPSPEWGDLFAPRAP